MKYFLILLILLFSHCYAQKNNCTRAFSYLKEGALDKSLTEFNSAFKSDSLLPNSSAVIDTLCKFLAFHPEKYETNYIIGALCSRQNFRYDAFYYLNNFIKHSPYSKYALDARNMLDTLHINTDDIKYADFIREYLTDVKNGRTGLEKYWDDIVKEKYGKDFKHWPMEMYENTSRDNLFTPVINITHYKEYILVKAHKFSYAIIEKDSHFLLSRPLNILTRGWYTKESRHFIFHSENINDFPDSLLILKLDCFVDELAKRFSLKNEKKINYYHTNWENMGRFYFDTPFLGMASPTVNEISSTLWNNYHEITHIITMHKLNFSISLLREGIANYYGGNTLLTNLLSFSWIKDLMLIGKEPKISKIYVEKEFDSSKEYDINDINMTAGTFNKYLIENFGMEKYIALCQESTSEQIFPQVLKEVYGKDIYSVENEFRQWLINQKLPEIAPEFNDKAEVVFAMDDPAGDDNGNGQYTYPKDQYCKSGIFDLTKFRVLRDSSKYYFELKFRDLVDRDSLDWGFYRTYAEIYIKTDKGDKKRTSAWDGNIDLDGSPAKVLLVSDKGIELINCKTYERLMIKLHKTDNRKFGDINRKTISFSVSKELLENIDSNCEFFVGIGSSELNPAYVKNTLNEVGSAAKILKIANDNNGGCGLNSNHTPSYFDVLVPKGNNQQQLFMNFSDEKENKALFPYVYNK